MMARDKTRAVLALAMALVLIASVVPAGAVAQEDGQENDGATTIDSCTTITEPGTYELADNLTNATANTTILGFPGVEINACVVVASDDVVLNGNGNAVAGAAPDTPGASLPNQTTDANLTNVTAAGVNETAANDTETATAGQNETVTLTVGIAVTPMDDGQANLTNVTVRDVTTTGWTGGMFATNVTGATMQGIDATDNVQLGFNLNNATNATVSDLRATDSDGLGVILWNVTDSTFTDVQAADNQFAGVLMDESHRNELTNVTATNQSIAGIAALNASNNTFFDVEVRNTAGEFFQYTAGLLFDNASDNFVVDATASDNRNWTYYSTNDSRDNFVLNLTADDQRLSFVATDVALRFDENATDEPGMPFVALDTGENASILVDVNWSATGAPTDVAENETLDAGDNLTDAEAVNATDNATEEPTDATANETAEPANATGDDADPAGEEIDETENETAVNETAEPANETDDDAVGDPAGEETDEAENGTAVNQTTNETANAF